MPSCNNCEYLEGTSCKAHQKLSAEIKRPINRPPFGGCAEAIVDQYLKEIQPGMKVLDVGCGTWAKLKNHCEKVGAHYEAIDTQAEYYGVLSVATRIENLLSLSFNDNTFDIVIGNQTMEHWAEFGCSLYLGLHQCFRVTKPGGKVFMNVPIHFHGTKPFINGNYSSIEKLFKKFSTRVTLEKWGQHPRPFKDFVAYEESRWYRKRPAHVLDIRAVKDKPLPKKRKLNFAKLGKITAVYYYPIATNMVKLKRMIRRKLGKPAQQLIE